MTTALSGTRMLRNTSMSRMNDSSSTSPMNDGRRACRTCSWRSRRPRREPPTATVTSEPAIAGGHDRRGARGGRGRRWPRPAVRSWACTCMIAASPAALGAAGDATRRRASALSVADELAERGEVGAPFGVSAASSSGPLNPGPKPSASRSYASRVVSPSGRCRRRRSRAAARTRGMRDHDQERRAAEERGPAAGFWMNAAPPVPEGLAGVVAAACAGADRTGRCCGRRSRAGRAAASPSRASSMSTPMAAPIATPRTNSRPITSRPSSAMTTVVPAKSTARPAVSSAATTADSGIEAGVRAPRGSG